METSIITKENAANFSIIQSIYEIRGYRVMLDFDLAARYGVETKRLKEQVRRNIERFEGEDFMFELTKNEVIELSRSQIATLNNKRGHNIKYPPFAFTQLGVAMLSSVLNSEKAIGTNRKIMRAFIAIQEYALNYSELNQKLDMYMDKTDRKIDDILDVLEKLITKKEEPRNPIGFKQKQINK
jgi:hypothetical protein